MKKLSKRELADAAWLKNQQLEMPREAPQERTVLRCGTVPESCPSCGRRQTYQSGWNAQFGDLLECGNCAYVIEVPREEHERFLKGVHDHFAALSASKKENAKGPRVRGAG
ncbi:MAG TPA: hypothetical protein VL333_13180 [Candidatus Saccharimonadales bacterium]|jgi:hypothetical protein|nr:hypothetical protein [Candidatus Saccharimonadales bacterium]